VRPISARRPFTLIELLVVVGIIGLLFAILMPALRRARETAHASKCLSNLRNISTGFMSYADDYEEAFPVGNAGNGWADRLIPYLRGPKVFYCAKDSENSHRDWAANMDRISYGYNILGLGFEHATGKPDPLANDGTLVTTFSATAPALRDATNTLVATDAGKASEDERGYYLAAPAGTLWPGDFLPAGRHSDRLNALFADGHADRFVAVETTTVTHPGNAAPINNYALWSPIR